MEKKEFDFKGFQIQGFLAIFVYLIILLALIYFSITEFFLEITVPVCTLILMLGAFGFLVNEPNNARVMVFFGNYKGTFKKTGFFWVNPFYNKKKITFRARNLDDNPIKVNDKAGNPIMIGLVLIWRVSDTYKAVFEIDSSSTTAATPTPAMTSKLMDSFEQFVGIQADAALREVAGRYAYDDNETHEENQCTLRSGGDIINSNLEHELNERLKMAGLEIVEARINNLAYAPEIAAVMLRRQQAAAIISAREKIVEGAVGMVELALSKISEGGMVELDNDKKAAMISNLLVVLCADEAAQPVLNTGSLYQ